MTLILNYLKKPLERIDRDIPGFSSNYSRIKLKKYDQDFKWDGKVILKMK